MTKFVSVAQMRARLPKLLPWVLKRSHAVVVTSNGRPKAILRNLNGNDGLRETLEILANPESMRQLRRSQRYFARGGKGYTIEQVFGKS
jgi:PHD/YefM family antitoxin component YafN of YafNO toxin-antitoxin module